MNCTAFSALLALTLRPGPVRAAQTAAPSPEQTIAASAAAATEIPLFHAQTYDRSVLLPVLREGEIGIFLVDNEGYIKEYRKDGLHSHNPAYAPLTFSENEPVHCVGKVIGKVGATGLFTIIEDKSINGVVYGKLKSGAGWVVCYNNADIKKGDWVKVINPIQYGTTRKFVVYVDKYKVLEVSGDRLVISADGKTVTAAIAKINVQKI